MKEDPLISIAIATYNGEAFLREQLDSIYSQTYKNIEIIVTDDCSVDSTPQILEEYCQKYGLRYYLNECNLGFLKNFEQAISLCNGEYIALCDQDDVWIDRKIELELSSLLQVESSVGKNMPVLVFSDLQIVNSEMKTISDLFYNPPNFDPNKTDYNHLLVQNVVVGCTVLFNRSLKNIALPIPIDAMYHDHWLAIVASIFGKIRFLDLKTVHYRQHLENCIGAGNRESSYLWDTLKRVIKLFLLPFDNQKFRATFECQFRLSREICKFNNLPVEIYETCNFWGNLQNSSFFSRKYKLIGKKLLRHTILDKVEMIVRL
ncbi:glycosyltransferase family 2 protein [Chamaesiphon polymorphus]|uniref:Glycosyltransferase family 2 protein n=1 Tax=Chamaesiphon polymorphus CCALA 037 TaxID=2107692 RepID=A0A2T1GMU7_9CYAN|nr:glycosyltransferase family 2 protein [Chamaesiphon polymorphus]PSB59236.1 glycosyltransferase family 2 protein [Chamaesiphon polymorphus CCALA 037]